MPCSNLRFLVVEDHQFQRSSLVRLLDALGAEAVYSAEDGNTALQVIHDPDRRVDVVISDLAMPGMDGMEFIRHLSETGERVSLILASALQPELLGSIASMALAYKVPLLGVVGKPVTAGKLSPLLDLHRSNVPPGRCDAQFPLDEVAQAWSKDEFEPWFEPKVDLATGVVRGMSAVARWRHPQQGWLEPASFMASIEARGLNDDFVWLMLRKSAAHCRRWIDLGHDLVVSVNLSFHSLTDPNLAARVQQIAQKEGIDPRCMVLGVNESALNTDLPKALENLARLRVLGFGLRVDDFGAGPMAVEQLPRVAFTELKINSAFVRGADCDESVRVGLAVGLAVASDLKLTTIAAGIGSKEEWNLLYEWGCVLGEGPFISAPLDGEEVGAWLARWQVQRGAAPRKAGHASVREVVLH
jgi:EAL domain-containing protein (putative c-di-GMP-specific phosphodiesterase class I)